MSDEFDDILGEGVVNKWAHKINRVIDKKEREKAYINAKSARQLRDAITKQAKRSGYKLEKDLGRKNLLDHSKNRKISNVGRVKEAGAVLGIAVIMAALVYITKKLRSEYSKCANNTCRKNVLNKMISETNKVKSNCAKTKDPANCKSKLDAKITKYKDKLNKL